MKGKGLGEARKLFRGRRFPEVIRLLEPEVFRFRENVEYFRLLGTSCLHAGDLGGAFSYLTRARQLKDDDESVLLGLAAIHFRRGESEAALKTWLEVLETQHSNQTARRGLDILRKGVTPDGIQDLIDSGRIKQLYPQVAPRIPLAIPVAFLVIAAVIFGGGYLAYRLTRPTASQRPGVSAIEIPTDLSSFIESGSDFTFILTEKEVRQGFQKARSALLAYHDNLAAVEINRILLSNAAASVKQKARLLKGFVTQATFDTLKDEIPYATVRARPGLYDGCSVRWKGKVANLKIAANAVSFDLLVGYDQEKQLEGIVPVTLPFATEITDGTGIEVLGQVIARDTGDLALLGISLHVLPAS
jgi:hypothetical protein